MEGRTEPIQPSHTLYVRNLNDKVQIEGKRRPKLTRLEMRRSLYHLFSTHGEVIQVRMRQT